MKPTLAKAGKISDHAHGMGTVTSEMVTERAREIAIINGRSKFSEDDWRQAKRELTGTSDDDGKQVEEPVAGLTEWDERPDASGHEGHTRPPNDEQTVAERLTQEGVDEANHDLMLKGSKRSSARE